MTDPASLATVDVLTKCAAPAGLAFADFRGARKGEAAAAS